MLMLIMGQVMALWLTAARTCLKALICRFFKCPNDYAKIKSPMCWGIDINVSP